MKANKLWKTLAASAMSLALMAGATVMPAMAAPVTGAGTDAVASFTITKNLTKEVETMVPNTTFNFTVSVATPGEGETRNGIPVSTGIEGGITVTSGAAFTPGEALDSKTTVTSTATFNVNSDSFKTPGIYKYTISENNDGYDGITYSTNTLDLYVYVQNVNGAAVVTYTELVDPDGGAEGGEVKTDSFTNDYDSVSKTKLHDLVLYKVVSGNAANMSEKFNFTVKIDGEAGEKYYVEYGTYVNGTFTKKDGQTLILTSGSEDTITLGHNEAVKIYALDSDDTYTITEQGANSNGYTLKINDEADGDGVTTGTISTDSNVKYENAKNATTPTGIVMNIAPYALMVVIAVAGVMVFMRKRVEE